MTSSSQPSESDHPDEVLVSDAEGLQLHTRRNLFQLAVIVACSLLGVALMWWFVPVPVAKDGLYVVLGGALVGMIAGTFLSGFILMFHPPQPVRMSSREYLDLYKKLCRRAGRLFVTLAILGGSVPVALLLPIRIQKAISGLGCVLILLLPPIYVYLHLLSARLQRWKCPRCGAPFKDGPTCEHFH